MERTAATPLSPTVIRIGTIVLAVVVNVIIVLIARGIAGEWPHAKVQGEWLAVTTVPATLATVVSGVGAWIAAAIIERQARRPAKVWLIVGVVVFLVSLISLTGAQNTFTAMTLGIMHLAAAAVITAGYLRTMPESRS
jgi:hypothetical protein